MTRLFLSDPSTFTGAFAVWAIAVGISLAGPTNVFELSPQWASLQAIYASDKVWGWTMIANGCVLLWSLRMHKVPQRAAISLTSAIMWFLIGVSIIGNAWAKGGFISIIGCYSVWCSVQAMIAVEQWVTYAPTHEADRGDR